MGSKITMPAAPAAPTPIDPGKSALDYMNSMADPELQQKILQSEQTYRPQYAALNLADLNSYMQGTGGQMGALDLNRLATESANNTQIAAISQQRGADIADVERYGQQASAAFLNANPELRASLSRADALARPQQNQFSQALASQLQQQQPRENIYAQQVNSRNIRAAQTGQSDLGSGLQNAGMQQLNATQGEQQLNQAGNEIMARGANASPLQVRNAVQQARIASQARGRGGDMSSLYGEVGARLSADLDVEGRNLSLGSQLLNQGFGMGQQRLGMAGNIYGQDLSRAQNNTGMQQQAAMANQQYGMQSQLANQQANLGAAESNRAIANQQYQSYIQNLGQGSQLANQELAANRGYAMGLVGARQATASDPFQAILGRGSNAQQMGMAQAQFAQGMAGQQGPQLFDPNAGINLALGQQANLNNYNANIFGSQAAMYGSQQAAKGAMIGGALGGLGAAATGGFALGGAFGCWVAREVFGEDNPKWLYFRAWLYTKAPKWFHSLYMKHGERFAAFIKNKPMLKSVIRAWMNKRIQNQSQLNLA